MERLTPLLHIDPVLILPPEITGEVFSYLDLQSLLRASTLSRSWRARALDSQLWRSLFSSEGWNANIRQVWHFEQAQRDREAEKQRERKARARPSDAVSDTETKSPKKRFRENVTFPGDDIDTPMLSAESTGDYPQQQWSEQHGTVEADEDERMEDVINDEEPPTNRPRLTSIQSNAPTESSLQPPVKPSLLLTDFGKAPRINWQYLFKQKRRLEENWQSGKFTNFQLPHPGHPHEAHAECIYTIQYSGKHLVSGSRDKTLRIWNLDTQRLALPPLRGHDASVLCLQFDASPDQDVIISGGSDCHVIIWQFSTGKILRKVEKAHSESVLNLRFDDRFLVTCSKDKTIKLWNRHPLMPTDDAYPRRMQNSASVRYPQHIISISTFDDLRRVDINPLIEYSLLMTLTGHTAAVNAIQILDQQIVSASGDRNIKVWDVKTGACLKTITGHSKGIACVQFDGRRIVSGSSDETVRIVDAISGADVARLRGHSDLVRTVQAFFGDIPGRQLEEEAEARALDRQFLASTQNGTVNMSLTPEQWRNRNVGSRDMSDIFAYGAKLPPGGGGSRWARIVSGSYDETIIIWKRDSQGNWVPAHQLNQWEAIIKAGGQPRFMPATTPQPTARDRRNERQQRRQAQAPPQPNLTHPANGPLPTPPITQTLLANLNHANNNRNATSSGSNSSVLANAASSAAAAASSSRQQQSQTSSQQIPHAGSSSSGAVQPNTRHTNPFAYPSPGLTPNTTQTPTPNHQLPQAITNHIAQTLAQQGLQRHAVADPQAQAAAQTAPGGQQDQRRQAGHHHHRGAQANATANARVYKLQFDARRIICCSQDPTIVGWDFANGDREIEIASEFFGEEG